MQKKEEIYLLKHCILQFKGIWNEKKNAFKTASHTAPIPVAQILKGLKQQVLKMIPVSVWNIHTFIFCLISKNTHHWKIV